ncbi:hypothetical protein [Aquimarina algiphila]|uniref:Uncharacterized protein n=1 Tax=Aquimarina algiphila TaxID=2047982 RepID=A0A554VE25_9FLAO|nr:hypothetical protein [Aquimarina algiphila]TSE05258.1 hypothetical protein FOF46_23635 [Aquimarina algiphila]
MTKITYDNKVGVKPKTVRKNQVWDDDMNEIKAVVNQNDDNALYQGVNTLKKSTKIQVTPDFAVNINDGKATSLIVGDELIQINGNIRIIPDGLIPMPGNALVYTNADGTIGQAAMTGGMSAYQESFLATDAQTKITLSRNIESAILILSVAGVSLSPSVDYTVLNNEISFSTPLEVGENVLVTYFLNSGTGSGGSGGADTNITYNVDTRQISSSTGTGFVFPLSNKDNAGLMPNGFYEEYTFFGSLLDVGGGATYTIGGSNEGRAIRIGKKVSFTMILTGINTVGTPSSQLQIEGFPETSVINEVPDQAGIDVTIFSGSNINFYSLSGNMSNVFPGGGSKRRVGLVGQTSFDNSISLISGVTFTNGVIGLSGFYFIP